MSEFKNPLGNIIEHSAMRGFISESAKLEMKNYSALAKKNKKLKQTINELCDLLEEARKKVGLVMIYPENDGNNPIELKEIIDEAVAKARGEHVSK